MADPEIIESSDSGAADSWRPVRIAPASFVSQHQALGFTDQYLDVWKSVEGASLRVRPVFGVSAGCYGRCYEIHPEDAERVIPDYRRGNVLCEHQILAD